MTTYLGIADRSADGTWSIAFPDLPGCTAQGRTIDEVRKFAAEAAIRWLRMTVDRGEPRPLPRCEEQLSKSRAVRKMLRLGSSAAQIIAISLPKVTEDAIDPDIHELAMALARAAARSDHAAEIAARGRLALKPE